MIFAKELILKGVAGLAVVGSAGAGVWWYTTQKPENNTPNEPTNELETLASNVGLSCTGTPNETTGVQCNKKADSKNIKVKKENDFDLSDITGGSIKVYKLTATGGGTTDYNKNFKFVIEGGDIGSGSSKLEEFETYEVNQEGNEWKLIRKSSAKDEIKKALGLPNDCTLPDSNESGGNNCSSITSESLKAINFKDKKEGGATFENGNGSVTLTIKKATSTAENPFPLGYSFTFKPTQKISIKSGSSDEDSLKANIDVEFKINKEGTSLSLEKAWTLESLAKEVGLESCNVNTKECSIKNESLKVKHDTSKEEGKSKTEPSSGTGGKIKFYKDTAGHKEGFKFVIEDGDIDLTGSSSTISKLEEFETYEIEEDGGKYYLSRKTKAFKEISKSLSLPSGCDQLESNSTDCSNITKETLKNIKFDGKNGTDVTVENSGLTIKLKVTKLTSSDNAFPHGYKFVLESNKEITIPKSPSGNITIKKDTNTEFKLKKEKTGENISLSLEKAWNAKSLGQKVGLVCNEPSSSEKTCTLTSGSINVHSGANGSKIDGASVKGDAGSKKIKYEEDKEGYNQGIKFILEGDSSIELEKSGSSGTIPSIENSSTSYEIKQDGGVWYLTKKPAPAA